MPHSILTRGARCLLVVATAVCAAGVGADQWSSPVLMRQLGRAVLKADLIALQSDAYQPDDRALDEAILRLDDGVAAADRVLEDCSEVLYPRAVRERSPDERRAYGVTYREQMAIFRAALVEYQAALATLRERPVDQRSTELLKLQRAEIQRLINVAHRDLGSRR